MCKLTTLMPTNSEGQWKIYSTTSSVIEVEIFNQFYRQNRLGTTQHYFHFRSVQCIARSVGRSMPFPSSLNSAPISRHMCAFIIIKICDRLGGCTCRFIMANSWERRLLSIRRYCVRRILVDCAAVRSRPPRTLWTNRNSFHIRRLASIVSTRRDAQTDRQFIVRRIPAPRRQASVMVKPAVRCCSTSV